jgi:hypothetical protein
LLGHSLIKLIRYRYANLLSSVFVIDDEASEKIRKALESTDVEQDITDFVNNKTTGTEPPG